MSTNTENYPNDVNGYTFTTGTSFSKEAPRDSQVVIQQNTDGVRASGRGARSKNKWKSPPASSSGGSTNAPATRLERQMEAAQSIRTQDNVAHSQANHHQLLLGNWNILTLTGKELELVEEAKRYHLDIISFFNQNMWLWNCGSGCWIETLLFWCWSWYACLSECGDSHNSEAPGCQTVCQIGFFWDHESACWSSRYWIGHCALNTTREYKIYGKKPKTNVLLKTISVSKAVKKAAKTCPSHEILN